MNIDLKSLKDTITEDNATSIPARTVLTLLNHIDALEEELKWRRNSHWLTGEADKTKKELNQALDALTMTQEEWLLRVKHLESQNYYLKEQLRSAINNNSF